jgi:erythromycin esterase
LGQGRLVNEYISGLGTASYEEVKEAGFGHGFGRVEANRELVEWMRAYNADPAHRVKLRFYGFDIPGTPMGYASPRQVLLFAVDYLSSIESAVGQAHRERVEAVLGQDAEWESTAVYADPSKAVGLTPNAVALRIATEDLITEFRIRRPRLIAASSGELYGEALQHALIARELLNCHAALARQAGYAHGLGVRDALMADNLTYIVERERGRGGRVLAFAHNGHLQRSKMAWPMLGEWWPAGSLVHETLGRRYAVIGTAVGRSEANGIGEAEAGSLEARLTAGRGAGTMVLIPTHRGEGLDAAEVAGIPVRSRSAKNQSYGPLVPQSLNDFDWLAVVDSTGYTRGARPLP